MSTNDKKFEIVSPTDWSRLNRPPFEVADKDLLNPRVASPKVPLMDGEFLQLNSEYKLVRATDLVAPAYALIEWSGAYETQASGKVAVLMGNTYMADTIVFDATSLVLHSPLQHGDVTVGGLTRRGLVLRTATNLILGYVTKLPASNGGRLRFLQTAV